MKKRIFLDTNIMLDLLGERQPFYKSIAQLATLADMKKIVMVVSPISFATVNYLLANFGTPRILIEKLRKFKIIREIGKIDEKIVEIGLNSNFDDFEDACNIFVLLIPNVIL